jgi:hypothetical protein
MNRLITLLAFTLTLSLSGCARSCSFKPEQNLPIGKPLFNFDPATATKIEIIKNDPEIPGIQNHWAARAERADKNSPWLITSAPENRPLADNLADDKFLNHFIDTLRTYSASAPAPNGPPSSFGLEQPYFAIRWTAADKTHELRLGNIADNNHGRFSMAPSIEPDATPQIFVGEGAVITMLDYIGGFESFRNRKLLTFDADDIDIFEIFNGKRRTFSAERTGDDWKPKKGGALLDAFCHLRIKRFIDYEHEIKKLRPLFASPQTMRALFKDRQNNPIELKAITKDGNLYVTIGNRNDAIFELFPEALRFFRN